MVGRRTSQKPDPDHLEPVRCGHAVELLIHGAHQHLPPKPLNHALRLTLFRQPLCHRDRIKVCPLAKLSLESSHASDECELLAWTQETKPEERLCEVCRSRQYTCTELRRPTTGLNKIEPVMPVDGIGNAESSVEIKEVGAATKENVLRVVDHCCGAIAPGQGVRCRAPARIGSRLINIYRIPGFPERSSRGKTG